MTDDAIFFSVRRAWLGAALFLIAAMVSGCGGGGSGASDSAHIHVACIGDSITYGVGIANPAQRYPAQLRALLGADYAVGNFGHPGATLLTSGELPYRTTQEYARSLADAPQIVVIMLGTNDAKPANWTQARDFESDYQALIAQYRALPTHPAIFLCLPPPVYASDAQADAVQTGVLPAVRRVAAETGCVLVDNNTPLQNHAAWFQDHIHPNADGAGVLAKDADTALLALHAP